LSPLPVLSAAPVTLRHITRAATGTSVVGATFAAQIPLGVNGRRGYQSGTYEPSLSETGTGAITLPNAAGEDGVLHRNRFVCLTDSGYAPGDEWIEVYQDGRVLFVGTPTEWDVSRTDIRLTLDDGSGLLTTQRETAAGFWKHAPRDVFEHYTKTWRTCVADDFTGGYDPTRWTATLGGAGSAITNQATSVRLTAPSVAASTTLAAGAYWRSLDLATARAWRVECRFSQAITSATGVALVVRGGGGQGATIQESSTGSVLASITDSAGSSASVTVDRAIPTSTSDVTLAIERHDRWVFFYALGVLIFATEATYTLGSAFPEISIINYTGAVGTGGTADLDYCTVRDLQPYLMRGVDKGDYRLPTSPPSGGLRGAYYDEADLRAVGDTSVDYYLRVLSPTRQPYARRQDTTINFTTVSPPAWQPATPASGAYFTARWTGAIFLDLATADVTLRLTSLDNGARLYVAKTMFGDHLLQQWANPTAAPYTLTSGSLRTHTGASLSGWYPLRLEYVQGASSGGIILQQSIGGGAYTVVPSTSLSPFGVYDAEVRYDSHAEQIRTLTETFGLQYRVEPRSLESGLFPGEMVPRIRVGRDTDKVLEPAESTEVAIKGSARDRAMTLLGDAAGLADQANAAQLTAEALDFDALWGSTVAGRHLAVASGYESLSDITDPNLLRTRLASMLTLRAAPWEEVGSRPRGHREIRDSFPPLGPLGGALALFDWEPGDGVRLVDEAVGLNDASPRQIIAPSWPFVPDGRGAPTIRFRQRPRSQQDALRQLIRAVLLPQRNYQGQIVALDGTYSHLDGAGTYSRVALPANVDDVVGAHVIVTFKSDTSSWTLRDGVTLATITTFAVPGTFDVLPWVQRRSDAVGGSGQEFIVERVAGTGSALFQLRLFVTFSP
jgi:hypothetical protein